MAMAMTLLLQLLHFLLVLLTTTTTTTTSGYMGTTHCLSVLSSPATQRAISLLFHSFPSTQEFSQVLYWQSILTMAGFKVGSKVIVKNSRVNIPAIITKAEGSKLWQIEYVVIENGRHTGNFVSGMKSQQMRKPKADEFPEEQQEEEDCNEVMSFAIQLEPKKKKNFFGNQALKFHLEIIISRLSLCLLLLMLLHGCCQHQFRFRQ
jgi:hypothetical protein